jgi:hypothetical protein
MTAAAMLERAKVDGVTLALDDSGKLKVRGDEAAVARWLPQVRANKPALVLLLSEPHRLWLVTHADGRRVSHSFTPPASRREVEGWYPGAVIEQEDTP